MSYLTYSNTGAIRNKELSPELVAALSFLEDMGLTADVFSGGQDAKGHGHRRTGSTRHDLGHAADIRLKRGDEVLDFTNPEHLEVFQEFVRRGKGAGLTGFGAGKDYMGSNAIHVGFGNAGVWGAKGRAANAPKWLADTYAGVESGPVIELAKATDAAPDALAVKAMSSDPIMDRLDRGTFSLDDVVNLAADDSDPARRSPTRPIPPSYDDGITHAALSDDALNDRARENSPGADRSEEWKYSPPPIGSEAHRKIFESFGGDEAAGRKMAGLGNALSSIGMNLFGGWG